MGQSRQKMPGQVQQSGVSKRPRAQTLAPWLWDPQAGLEPSNRQCSSEPVPKKHNMEARWRGWGREPSLQSSTLCTPHSEPRLQALPTSTSPGLRASQALPTTEAEIPPPYPPDTQQPTLFCEAPGRHPASTEPAHILARSSVVT